MPMVPSLRRMLRKLLWSFIGLSAAGLIISAWVHFEAVAGEQAVPEAGFWLLHFGVFVVAIPAAFAAQALSRNGKRKDFWKDVLRGAPRWMRYMMWAFFVYAGVNLLLFLLAGRTGGSQMSRAVFKLGGYSGHWMAFYSASLAILYSGLQVLERAE
jgi:hypothetical protein